MKRLIVNADDLGLSPGVNRGILEAHRRGVVTSTSLLVDTPWSEEAAALARDAPDLSVGLHVDLVPGYAAAEGEDGKQRVELSRQAVRFADLMGRAPTHLDTHHNVHRDGSLLAPLLELAARFAVPLRGHSPVRCVTCFYGQGRGVTYPELVGVDRLIRLLESEVGEGWTELIAHPGYRDERLRSSYAAERELELQTLVDPRIRAALAPLGIDLVGFREVGRRSEA